ncbi:hypothetical protein HRTV-28_gp13 [Halorubrum tailed virus 28]|uniref:Uncharacterized protein n=1 Tax=Halorubrum tailed virus 28 TaxID=2878009 RepID=A0AAE8Y0W0_9CAUD|nr:hypothetical protein M1M39_gp14 [Halorubrum tailed virus 28]UBF23451.1 hypothetical protein HRTV-28_gp13 [Halorubrum tailed virus 28]
MTTRTEEAQNTHLVAGDEVGATGLLIPRDGYGLPARYRPLDPSPHRAWAITVVAGPALDLSPLVIRAGTTYRIPEGETEYHSEVELDGELDLDGELRLVSDTTPDADLDVEAAVSTSDDTEFTEWAAGGTTATAEATGDPPARTATIYSDEATVGALNARLTPQTEATSGVWKVTIEARDT